MATTATARRHISLRVTEEELARIDGFAEEHGLNRTDYSSAPAPVNSKTRPASSNDSPATKYASSSSSAPTASLRLDQPASSQAQA